MVREPSLTPGGDGGTARGEHTRAVTTVVYGAGAVGLVLGARLARAGDDVLFVTRRPEVADRIAREGVRVEDLSTRESWSATARATSDPGRAAEGLRDAPVLFCMRRSQLEAAAEALAAETRDIAAVSFQNDVDNEECLTRYFETVIGGVYRQTCTRRAPNHAVTAGPGRVILGSYPRGRSAAVEELAGRLRAAGYDVGVAQDIRKDLWLKLCVNLTSSPNALIRREDHGTAAFFEIKVRLLEEARTVLAAAGIEASSCDGRDRSLEAEIEFQRRARERGMGVRRLPLYNQVWAALRHGLPLESTGYHERLLDLAARHGLELPMNERVLAILARASRESLGPECMDAAAFLAGL